jgi:hypothetical protein
MDHLTFYAHASDLANRGTIRAWVGSGLTGLSLL